ncbi:MAG: hypothetical protein ACKODN_03730, partial [Actinomycetota bacterium]
MRKHVAHVRGTQHERKQPQERMLPQPNETSADFLDERCFGWLRTGDLGTMVEGLLRIDGRR